MKHLFPESLPIDPTLSPRNYLYIKLTANTFWRKHISARIIFFNRHEKTLLINSKNVYVELTILQKSKISWSTRFYVTDMNPKTTVFLLACCLNLTFYTHPSTRVPAYDCHVGRRCGVIGKRNYYCINVISWRQGWTDLTVNRCHRDYFFSWK